MTFLAHQIFPLSFFMISLDWEWPHDQRAVLRRNKMCVRVKRNPLLLGRNSSLNWLKAALEGCSADVLQALCEISHNLLRGNIPISACQYKTLKHEKHKQKHQRQQDTKVIYSEKADFWWLCSLLFCETDKKQKMSRMVKWDSSWKKIITQNKIQHALRRCLNVLRQK